MAEVLMEVVEDVEVAENVELVEYVEVAEEVEMVDDGVEEVEMVEEVEVADDGVEEVEVEMVEEVAEDGVEDDIQVEEIEYVLVVELPIERAPIINRQAGVTHPIPERHYVGAFDRVCRHCNARHFSGEETTRGHFSACCNNGQMVAAGQHALLPVPYLIQSLFIDDSQEGRTFRENFRRLNNLLAFAAFASAARDRRLPGRGPRVFIVHGQTYRTTNNEVDVAPENAYNCQLYFLESADANRRRVDIARRTIRQLCEIVIGLLDSLLRDINPYAMALM